MDILIVTLRPTLWTVVFSVIKSRGASVRQATSLEQGLELVRQQSPTLVVFDMRLEPEELRKAVIDLLTVNAMPYTVAVSQMTKEEFHDKMEGLGLLMLLPVDFSIHDVEKMITTLERVIGL